MKLDAINKYDGYSRFFTIPKGTILSPKQVKAAESGLENTKIVRNVLANYYERKGKAQSESARELDMCLGARETFLRMKLYFFDKTRKDKWQEELNRSLEAGKRERLELRQKQQLTIDQWLGPFTI